MVIFSPFKAAAIILSLSVPIWSKRLIPCKGCAIESRLQSPAIGIDISPDFLTAAVKFADGRLSQLAKVPASDELRRLMQEWAKESIAFSPDVDAPEDALVDGERLTAEVDILYPPLKALIDRISRIFSALDLPRQSYSFSLPPFVQKQHVGSLRQAAHKIGLTAIQIGMIAHSDDVVHSMYNAMYCRYHQHPHSPLCSTGELLHGGFESLIIDYTSSLLTVTWKDTYGTISARRTGFADASLGARSPRDRQYWVAMEQRVASLLKEREKLSLGSPQSTRLILLGECGADGLLRRFLHDVLAGTPFDLDNVVIHDAFDLAFAGALSAAGVLKALMDAPEPYYCNEPPKCKELRERVYEEAKRNYVRSEL